MPPGRHSGTATADDARERTPCEVVNNHLMRGIRFDDGAH